MNKRFLLSGFLMTAILVALLPGSTSAPFVQAQETGHPTIIIYWTDKGINQWQEYENRPSDNFGSNFTAVFPVGNEGRILVLMSATQQVSQAEIERRLEERIMAGLQAGITTFEIRTVQRIGTVGYLNFVSTQPDVVEFTCTFLEALNNVKSRLTDYDVTIHGVVGSNGGYVATESIPYLDVRGTNPVYTLTIIDGRAYAISAQQTIDALEGRVTLVNTRGDFWALPDMVANSDATRWLKDQNPWIRVFLADTNPEGLNINWFRYHIATMDMEGNLLAIEYLGDGRYSEWTRFVGADFRARIIPGAELPSEGGTGGTGGTEDEGTAITEGTTPNPPPWPPPPTPNGGGGAVVISPSSPPLFSFPPPTPPPPPPPGGGGAVALTSPFLTGDQTAIPPELSGVDFSSLELHYFTEFTSGQGNNLAYVFRASRAEEGVLPVAIGQTAETTSDAFFVWLALPSHTFWVNLNPNEPNRIIDSELGQTDAGRIMLEADFQMKKTVAALIHPDSELGQAFWDQLYDYVEEQGLTQLCFSFRQWIVPGEVTVWTTADSIYIVDAALDVKLESEYLELRGETAFPAAACPPGVDPALQTYAENLFREMILPELIEQVNTAPEYHDLRSIFYSRIIAEWYKTQHLAGGQAAFSDLIDQGHTCECYTTTDWDPTGLFDQYVQSVTQGEFNITRQEQTTQGDYIVTTVRTYFYGGVDFIDVPATSIAYDELVAQKPAVEQQVLDALFTPTGYWDATEVWLGGLYFTGLPEAEAAIAPASLDLTAVPPTATPALAEAPTVTPNPTPIYVPPSEPTALPQILGGTPCTQWYLYLIPLLLPLLLLLLLWLFSRFLLRIRSWRYEWGQWRWRWRLFFLVLLLCLLFLAFLAGRALAGYLCGLQTAAAAPGTAPGLGISVLPTPTRSSMLGTPLPPITSTIGLRSSQNVALVDPYTNAQVASTVAGWRVK